MGLVLYKNSLDFFKCGPFKIVVIKCIKISFFKFHFYFSTVTVRKFRVFKIYNLHISIYYQNITNLEKKQRPLKTQQSILKQKQKKFWLKYRSKKHSFLWVPTQKFRPKYHGFFYNSMQRSVLQNEKEIS